MDSGGLVKGEILGRICKSHPSKRSKLGEWKMGMILGSVARGKKAGERWSRECSGL